MNNKVYEQMSNILVSNTFYNAEVNWHLLNKEWLLDLIGGCQISQTAVKILFPLDSWSETIATNIFLGLI